jgi:two-component system, NtrC family, sensor histidine kinase KinB
MSGELILVVDDSREIARHLGEFLLPTLGHRAIVAFDGRQGLQLIQDEHPDLVILDLNLPEMTGLDVLEAMARLSIETPVILMTGYGSEKSAIEAFRLGIKDYLVKPFTVEEVSNTIHRALMESRLRHDKERLLSKLQRAEGEMRRQIREMRSLFALGKSVTALLQLDEVVERSLQGALDLTNAESAILWLPDAQGTHLQPQVRSIPDIQLAVEDMPVDGSVAGEVFRSGEIVRQAAFTTRGGTIRSDFRARAVLYVPLIAHGQNIGVLCVGNDNAPRAFSERDELLLSALSDYVAVAVANAQTYQRTDEALASRAEELKTLLNITRTITSSLDLDEVAQLTIQQVHRSWNIEASSLWLLDEANQRLRVLANVGTNRDLLSRFQIDVGQGIVGHVAATGEPLYTNDVNQHPLHFHEVDEKTGFDTHSLLCVPLVFHEHVIGALQLLNKLDGPFTEDDVARAVSIAIAVAIAVSNAQLFAESASRQQLLASTLEYNGNPIIITNREERLFLLNQRARQLFGLSEAVIGEPVGDVLPVPELAEMLVAGEKDGAAQQQELRFDMTSVWLCTVAPIPSYGRILVLQDITYLKDLDAAKSNFIATVSHDLRAPLNSIAGFAQAMNQVGPLTQQQQEFANRISDSAERMNSLVSALLDLARVDSRMERVREQCDVRTLVGQVLTELQGQALTRQIELELGCKQPPPVIRCDPTQIHQAVSNLVDNAIKYSPVGGRVEVSLESAGNDLIIMVRDSGRGIPAKDVPYIFDKFYRVNDKGQTSGVGLGLALVRSIAEAHGGTVRVETAENEGSTFFMQLPAENGSASS